MGAKNNHFTYRDGVSLREYFEARLEATKLATDLAREGMEKRLEGMNEFRQAMKDQASNFITRIEFAGLAEKIGNLNDTINKRPTWLMTFIFLVMSFLLGLLTTHFSP